MTSLKCLLNCIPGRGWSCSCRRRRRPGARGGSRGAGAARAGPRGGAAAAAGNQFSGKSFGLIWYLVSVTRHNQGHNNPFWNISQFGLNFEDSAENGDEQSSKPGEAINSVAAQFASISCKKSCDPAQWTEVNI